MNVLVTGGAGSLGTALTHAFLQRGYRVTVFSRDPHKQARLQAQVTAKNYLGHLRLVLGDVTNQANVLDVCAGQDLVVHAAALKIVQRGETDASEYARVNIDGTRNVAHACQASGVQRGLFISSDKAIAPLNNYGKTKAVGESIWLSHNTDDTHMAVLRYGNVITSNGSVWQVWQQALASDQPLHVREPEPTRFALTIDGAVALVMDAFFAMWRNSTGGQIFVPYDIPAFSIYDLARELQPDESQWLLEPLTAGEKQHEVLLAPEEYARPTPNSKFLWQLCPRNQDDYRPVFCSTTAQRMSGAEIITMIEG